MEIKANDVLTNSRTKISYSVDYVATPNGKILKQSKIDEVCLLNLQGVKKI